MWSLKNLRSTLRPAPPFGWPRWVSSPRDGKSGNSPWLLLRIRPGASRMLWSVISAVERAFHSFLNRPGSRDPGPGRLGGFQSAEARSASISECENACGIDFRVLKCTLR